MIIEFPYGRSTVELDLPDKRVLSVIRSRDVKPASNEVGGIDKALFNPIKSEKLMDIASKKKKICIIVSDHTRATPNQVLIPPILKQLKKAGQKMDDVNILVANGLHKPASNSELEELLGKTVLEEVNVFHHDAEDEKQLEYLGKTSLGTDVSINKFVTKSDFTIATGLIEPHFFAGYSGGKKAFLPGVAGKKSVFQNHGFKMIGHPNSRSGILDGNPISEDMVEAAKLARQNYMVNVVLDKNHKIIKTFAGDLFEAHRRGATFLDKIFKVKAESKADIIITTNGGYPLDRDLYQSVKGMVTGELVVKKGGVIIILSECVDGIGRGCEPFYQLLAEAKNPNQTLERIKIEEPIPQQWEAQVLARILNFAKVITVTKNIKHSLIEDMHMIPAFSPEEALRLSYQIAGEESKIIAIPEGPYVIPTVNQDYM